MEKPSLGKIKSALLNISSHSYVDQETKDALWQEMNALETTIGDLYETIVKRKELNDLREFITHSLDNKKKKEVKPTIDAMSETELVTLIMRYDTSYTIAADAYKALQRLDVKKWKDLPI